MNVIHDVIETEDHIRLPLLLYPKIKHYRRAKRVAIYLHGTGGGSVFYSKAKNETWAEALQEKGIDFITFNNRGANVIVRNKWYDNKGKKHIELHGCAYELMKDCVIDIGAVIRWAQGRGYQECFLIGHSTGANKIVLYDYLTKGRNDASAYVLSAGGDDTGLWYNQLGKVRFEKLLNAAKEKVDAGGSLELVDPKLLDGTVFSWQSLLDLLDPEGDYNLFPFHEALSGERLSKRDLFKEFSSITKPVLAVYGENDEYAYGRLGDCVEALKRHSKSNPDMEYSVFKDAGHDFDGHLTEVARYCAQFLFRHSKIVDT